MSDFSKQPQTQSITSPIIEASFLLSTELSSGIQAFLREKLEISPMLFELMRGTGDHFQPKGFPDLPVTKSLHHPLKLPSLLPKRMRSEERKFAIKKPTKKLTHKSPTLKPKKTSRDKRVKACQRPKSTMGRPRASEFYLPYDLRTLRSVLNSPA